MTATIAPEVEADGRVVNGGDAVVWHALTAAEASTRLDVDPPLGLDRSEVERRRAQVGPNKLEEVASEGLVPGDIVSFEAGDKIPADGRLLVAATLEIEEAALTGESTPVLKAVEPVTGEDVALGDRVDMAYMNST